MSRIYHYDTTWEQIGENDAVIGSAELRIFYTVTSAGGDGWNEPRYPAQAEFHNAGVEIGSTRKYRDLMPGKGPPDDETLYCWAQDFAEKHQDDLLMWAGQTDEREGICEEHAAEMRAEMRRDER